MNKQIGIILSTLGLIASHAAFADCNFTQAEALATAAVAQANQGLPYQNLKFSSSRDESGVYEILLTFSADTQTYVGLVHVDSTCNISDSFIGSAADAAQKASK